MSYLAAVLRRNLLLFLLFLALGTLSTVSTYVALTRSDKIILIGIDGNGTRVISKDEDPLFKTEVVNFVRGFVALMYNFDPTSYQKNVGDASNLMSTKLFEQDKDKLIKLGQEVEKVQIQSSATLMHLVKNNDGSYGATIRSIENRRLSSIERKLKLNISILKTKRTEANPWGMEIDGLTEEKLN